MPVPVLVRREPYIRIASVQFWIDADGKPVIDIEATRVDGPRRESPGHTVRAATGLFHGCVCLDAAEQLAILSDSISAPQSVMSSLWLA
uniref:Uncharacterized protein n=1 Tax=Ralstonia solanacearum TaxID=305 RepID=A0A0S4TUX4_RALSL|nr:protein of unknown function [Ralstonia solanacearum]